VALTIVFCMVAIGSYSNDGVDLLNRRLPLSWKIGNVPISYVGYLGKFLYPVGLAVPYPCPGPDLPLWRVLGAVAVLVLLTAATLVWRRRRPYLLVGWLWYLGMLVPVSGILHFSMLTMADRFTYLPQIGLGIALTWGFADALQRWPRRRAVCGIVAALLLAVSMGCAWRQTSFWRDNETLWNHTLACTPPNGLAHHALGNTFLGLGRIDKAIEHFEAAAAIEPNYAKAHYNLAAALASVGRFDEAIEHYEKAVEIQPKDAAAHNNLGQAFLARGEIEKGMAHCQEAMRLDPSLAEAHDSVGSVLYVRGQVDEAIEEYRKALTVRPGYAAAHSHLGVALAKRGQFDDAIEEYRKALEAKADFADQVHNYLGVALAARGKPDEAAIHFRKALAINPAFAEARYNLNKVLADRTRIDQSR